MKQTNERTKKKMKLNGLIQKYIHERVD